ncbi:hypothetical protein CANARDRAFT_123100 [[Candida] arabinofermentans NRRL YB-2248]|uniref:Zn(2)-C6 fungal-type domain-containing protein n=1 Tax=[Candida] arabinofermentans NRRL YB-2248 TaxID=983967 RepID=A0A1E4ST09_9ASCO|nr:hypothetical protein CANARDRAFT_123100 [[Candida] arabinofermentans NRRL YB-2248]
MSVEKLSPNTQQGKKTIKYKRRRSTNACSTCHKRKVRCDASIRAQMGQKKCTNCFEFGIECIVSDGASSKRGNGSRSSSKKPSQIQQQPDNDSLTQIEKGFAQPLVGSIPEISKSGIQLDPKNISISYPRTSVATEYFDRLSPLNIIKLAVPEYIEFKNTGESQPLPPHIVDMLTVAGCFDLPDEHLCHLLIEQYFETYDVNHMFMNKIQFLKDNADLRKPRSLLLLLSVLFAGSKGMSMATWDAEQTEITSSLYRKAKTVLMMGIEKRPIELVSSRLILLEDADSETSFETAEQAITSCISIAFNYSMNQDQTNSTRLSDSEKKHYKILFWSLFVRDRLFSLQSMKPYMINLETCSVPMLNEEDMFDDPNADVAKRSRNYEWGITVIKFCELIGAIAEQQRSLNTMAARGQPYTAIVKHIDMTLNSFLSSLPPGLTYTGTEQDTFECIALHLLYLFLEMVIVQTNLARTCSQLYKIYHNQSNVSLHDIPQDSNEDWGKLFNMCHDVCKCATSLYETDRLGFLPQSMIFQLYLSAVRMLPHVYNVDESIAMATKQDLIKFSEIFQSLKKLGSPARIWPHINLCQYMLDVILPDEKLLVPLLRTHIRANEYEYVSSGDSKVSPLLRAIAAERPTIFRSPIINLESSSNASVFESDFIVQPGDTRRLADYNSAIYSRFLPNPQFPANGNISNFHNGQPNSQATATTSTTTATTIPSQPTTAVSMDYLYKSILDQPQNHEVITNYEVKLEGVNFENNDDSSSVQLQRATVAQPPPTAASTGVMGGFRTAQPEADHSNLRRSSELSGVLSKNDTLNSNTSELWRFQKQQSNEAVADLNYKKLYPSEDYKDLSPTFSDQINSNQRSQSQSDVSNYSLTQQSQPPHHHQQQQQHNQPPQAHQQVLHQAQPQGHQQAQLVQQPQQQLQQQWIQRPMVEVPSNQQNQQYKQKMTSNQSQHQYQHQHQPDIYGSVYYSDNFSLKLPNSHVQNINRQWNSAEIFPNF